MGRWTALIVLMLTACGRPGADDGATGVIPDPDRIEGGNQVLPAGVVGEPWQASVRATGGRPPITFEVADDTRLPLGLTMTPEGRLSGVPAEAGTRMTQVVARDQAGQSQRFLVSTTFDLVPGLIGCGESIVGTFTASAIRTTGPVWEAVGTPNLQWLGVPWPQGDNTQVEIAVTSETTVGILVQRPNQPEGSLDWREDYVSTWIGTGSGTRVRLDPGTLPSLPAYATQGLVPILMVAFGPADYRVDVTCSDGPVFRQTLPLPVRLGNDFTIDYEVYGDNSDITFTIDGDLPDWVAVDEATGVLAGTAIEEVTVPLEVTATSSDGRSRTVDSIFGVFDPRPITCGESSHFLLEETYYDGPVAGYYDPRGYRVFELDVPATVSAVQWSLAGVDGQYLGLVDHDETRHLYFGGADTAYAANEPALLEVSPRTYPATRHYRDAGKMYVVAAPTGASEELTVGVTCDEGPRPNHAGLPVVQPLVATDAPLRAIGGTPPWTFEAVGLPSGLAVSGSRLVGSTGAVGVHPVQLTVTDADGATFTDDYELSVGLDVGCDGGQRVECGDAVSGTFDGTFFQDPSTESQARLCFYPEGTAAVGFELASDGGEFRADVGDPGVRGSTFLQDNDLSTYAGVVFDDDTEAVALNPFSWPALPDYEGLPVHLALRAVEPGDWSVRVECEASPP